MYNNDLIRVVHIFRSYFMSVQQFNQVAYGLSQSLLSVFPQPIISNRAPSTGDKAQLGTVWVDKPNNNAYVITSIINNSATWIGIGGGAGDFSSLTVTPGPISLTGATTINTTGTAATTIGNDDGVIIIGGAAQTSTITIGESSASRIINLGTGTGDLTLNMGSGGGDVDIVIGSTNSTSSTLVQAGTQGISLNSSVGVEVLAQTAAEASPNDTVIIDSRIGVATFTGFTTAGAASEVFTITNALVTVGSAILCSVSNLGANDAQMTVTRITPGAGSFDVTLTNNGAGALNGDILITFWVVQ